MFCHSAILLYTLHSYNTARCNKRRPFGSVSDTAWYNTEQPLTTLWVQWWPYRRHLTTLKNCTKYFIPALLTLSHRCNALLQFLLFKVYSVLVVIQMQQEGTTLHCSRHCVVWHWTAPDCTVGSMVTKQETLSLLDTSQPWTLLLGNIVKSFSFALKYLLFFYLIFLRNVSIF